MKKILIILSFILVSFAGFSQTTVADLIQMQFGLNGGINIRDKVWHNNINAYAIQFIDKTVVDSLSEYAFQSNGSKVIRWTVGDTIPAGTQLVGNFTRIKCHSGAITNGNPRVRYYPKK